ncbi:MAG TPA: hypothetical protein PLW93_01995 [Candidatus Absconditabacterales bacterium]|nr:hypothetical protein [Candidatus Absconditabacterales bacterium]
MNSKLSGLIAVDHVVLLVRSCDLIIVVISFSLLFDSYTIMI